MESVIAGLGFITISTLVLCIHSIMNEEKNKIKNRIDSYTRNSIYTQLDDEAETKKKPAIKDILKTTGKVFAAHSYSKKIEKELYKADIPMKGEEFLSLILILSGTAGFIGYTLLGGVGQGVILIAITIAIPLIIIQRKKAKRIAKINLQISESLNVMSNSLRAGYSFQQSIDLVSKEMSGPLAKEFAKTIREIHLGTTTDEALLNLTNRVDSEDLELLITAVLIQRQIGGNLAEILDNISQTIRDRIAIKGEIMTLTAQGRMSGLIVGLLPVALFAVLMLINPTYMSIMLTHKLGWIIIAAGIASELIGVYLIKKVVNIEV